MSTERALTTEPRDHNRAPQISTNQIFVCPPSGPPLPWDPPDIPWGEETLGRDYWWDLVFLGRVLVRALARLDRDDLTFYVTRNIKADLPSYGPNVVAIVLADEWGRIPPYAHEVRAVFKRYGTRPYLVGNVLTDPTPRNARKFVQYCHKWVKNVPGRINFFTHTGSLSTRHWPLHIMPVGYSRQEDLAFRDLDSRPIDVFFDGSIAPDQSPRFSLRRVFGTVKGMSRVPMAEQARRLRARRTDLNVEIAVREGFGVTARPGERTYSDRLMDTKLCLTPSGNGEETHRLHEAWRYGCIPVVDTAMPPLWYLRDAPVLTVKEDWSDLDTVVSAVLDDPARLRALQEKVLDHWQRVCSEDAVATYIASRLRSD